MRVYIHTYGRLNKQHTLTALRAADVDTVLVVQQREARFWLDPKYDHLRQGAEVAVLPEDITTLSPTRQWILEHASGRGEEKLVMMDDDLRFAYRATRPDGTVWLPISGPEQVRDMLCTLEDMLGNYYHVGVSAREGNNRQPEPFAFATRMMRVLGYRPADVLATGARFDRMRTKQDFDMTLQLLRYGRENCVTYMYAQDQAGGSQATGGCASYRTPQMMDEDAQRLAELHPGFVKVVEKTTKSAWGGGKRVDVQIAWKKAYSSSMVDTSDE